MCSKTESEITENWQTANPKVSISCTTYNHENFIGQALDSFLMQETSFPIEILIHDDASSDNTAEIIREYETEFPKLIRPIYQIENQMSKLGGGMNPTFNYPRAKGEYIALCEGDDYWTDPKKLQKQVEFLDQNKEYILCFHDCEILQNGKLTTDYITDTKNKITFETEDLLYGNFIHTPSVVFRNIGKFMPSGMIGVKPGDYLTYLNLSLRGKIYRINQRMAVYRVHKGGSWSTLEMNIRRKKRSRYMKVILDNFSHPSLHIIRKKYIINGFLTLRYDFPRLTVKEIFILFLNLLKESIIYLFGTINKFLNVRYK